MSAIKSHLRTLRPNILQTRDVLPGILSALLAVNLIFMEPVSAENQSTEKNLPICVAYNSFSKKDTWGMIGRKIYDCPNNSIIIAAVPGGEGRRLPSDIFIFSTCCKLPMNDFFLEETVKVKDHCPDNYVATGANAVPKSGVERKALGKQDYLLHCTKINTSRYQLGQHRKGLAWGNSRSSWEESRRIALRDIPASMRHAVGRIDRYNWTFEGCVGYPFGSALTAKTSKRCRGMLFRQIQYLGIKGDPPKGTPVQIFPSCTYISDRFDPNAKCEN